MLARYTAGEPGKPLIVLVHGMTDGAVSWLELMRRLRGDFFLVAVDLPGHGLSDLGVPDSGSPFSPVEIQTAAIEETLGHLQRNYGQVPAVIGHSMGGALVAEIVSRRPELASALVLEDPAWVSDQWVEHYRRRGGAWAKLAERWRAQPEDTLRRVAAKRPGWGALDLLGYVLTNAQVDPAALAPGEVTPRGSWQQVAAALAVPTLLITTDTPKAVVAPASLEEIATIGNPNLQVQVISGASHAVRADEPVEYERIVRAFLARGLAVD